LSWERTACAAATVLCAGGCRSTATAQLDGSSDRVDGPGDSPFAASNASSVTIPALTVENRAPGQFVLHANAAIKIATKALIERRSNDGRWTAYEDLEQGKGYRLMEACSDGDVPPCRTLAAGEVLVPEPWSGYGCSAQCNQRCDKNAFSPGAHRLIVSTCDDAESRYEGLPFEIPPTPMVLARQRAASNVVRATVVRLDPRRAKDDGEVRSADRRAGFAVVAGTEKELEVDGRSELLKWLRGQAGFEDGFDDTRRRGCKSDHLVGFLLTSSAAPGRETTAEIALDFACNYMTVIHEQGGRRETTLSFFERSRSVILGIASRGLPLDAELSHLP
jgi:hypothetical protein